MSENELFASFEDQFDEIDTSDIVDLSKLSTEDLLEIWRCSEQELLEKHEALFPRSQHARDLASLRGAAITLYKQRFGG